MKPPRGILITVSKGNYIGCGRTTTADKIYNLLKIILGHDEKVVFLENKKIRKKAVKQALEEYDYVVMEGNNEKSNRTTSN